MELDRDLVIRRARDASLINEELAPHADLVRRGNGSWEVRFRDSAGHVIARVEMGSDGSFRFAA